MNLRRYIIFIWLMAASCIAVTAGGISQVTNLLRGDGLSSQRIFSIEEDKDGAIWISTRTGVDRYNGRHIRNYDIKADFYYGDLAGRVIMLYEQPTDGDSGPVIKAYDNLGNIYEYSPIYDRFNLTFRLGDEIDGPLRLNRYCQNGSNEYFCLTTGLFVKNGQKAGITIMPGANVSDIAFVDNNIYVGTWAGLYKISGGKAQQINPTLNVQCLKVVGSTMYIGTLNEGLWKMDLKSGAIGKIPTDNEVFNNPIRAIVQLDDKKVAIGIDGGGIYTIQPDVNASPTLLIDTSDNTTFSLQGNGIYALTTDRWGNLWVGSYTGGVSNIKFNESPHRAITHTRGNNNSLGNNNVNAIAENTDGSLWYATDHGVSISSGNQWTHALDKFVGLALCPMNNGNMMFGTYGEGIYILDRNGGVTKHINRQSGATSNYIFAIERDLNGDFWAGALDGDLMHLDAAGNIIDTYPIKLVNSIECLDKNRIAVATVDGFYIIDKASKNVTSYATAQEQRDNNVSAYIVPMLYCGNNTIWLGTEGGGLTLYDIASHKILKNYKIAQGLPSDDVFGLVRDKTGRLWVSTGNGIAVINDTIVSSLNYLNGIGTEFNKNAATKLTSGNLVFGSTWGAMFFSPDDIVSLDYEAPLRITSFEIDGLSEEEREELMPRIFESINNGKISLGYNENSFIINFESLNLKYQDDIGYRYMLEGYDKEWRPISKNGVAEYKYVMPGNYKLKICSIRLCDGSVLDTKEIQVSIAHPWWNRWWAWILYVLILAFFIYVGFRYKLSILRKKQDADKIRFFVNTAHDIRTPVTLAMAPLDDLQSEESLTQKGSYLLGLARQNIRKLNAIITQLLEFEKINWNKKNFDLYPVDMNNVIKGELSCFSTICSKKNIELSSELPDESLCINGDIDMLEMVIDNLLSNAYKYTPEGGKIDIMLKENSGKVVIQIKDNGIGIPVKAQKHIFADIYRAKNARETQETGTGFGLLQVSRIVKALKGKITFTSEEGKGTLFTLTFDRIDAKAENRTHKRHDSAIINELSTPQPANENPDEFAPQSSSILIVEDNDDLRSYLGTIFARDFNVILKSSADEALKYLETGYPDLIISDIMMPGMQGDEFCHILKNNSETAGIPIILLTAKADHESVAQGLRQGADDYIPKPFNSEILRLKVGGLLENRARLRNYLLSHAIERTATPDKDTSKTNSDTVNEDAAAILSQADSCFIQKATDIILRNIQDADFSIDSLCKEMAMSRTLFYNRLKSLTGKAPQEFIRLLRLEKAADLLRNGHSVNDVADMTGFVNTKYFSTVFKKYFGVQPSKYIS